MKNEYYTFAGYAEALFTEKKSRFISAGTEVFTENGAADFLEYQRLLHKEANHHVYAYRLFDIERASDDREPSGTAGSPILNILKTEGMRNTIIVVTRYFGGRLLGRGGLINAYSKSAKLLFQTSRVIKKVRCNNIFIKTDYVFLGKLQYYAAQSDALITKISYSGKVDLELIAREESTKTIISTAKDLTNGSIETHISDSFFHEYPFSQRA